MNTRRGSRKKQVLTTVGGALLALALAGCSPLPAAPERAESAGVTDTPDVVAPEATPEIEEGTVGLADAVWAQVEANFPGGISSGSPLYAVTGVEDVSSGTIRVYVQETLTDEGREEVARHIVNMGAAENDALETIVVRDASGTDSNHYR